MLGSERDRNHFEVGVADLTTVCVVAGTNVGRGAAEQDQPHLSSFVLPIEMIKALFFCVIGFVAVDDLFEVAADAGLLHRLMLVAPSSGGHENVAQTGF